MQEVYRAGSDRSAIGALLGVICLVSARQVAPANEVK